MGLFQNPRQEVFLIVGIILSLLIAVLGIVDRVDPFELSQLLIVLVFLAIAISIMERHLQDQSVTDKKLDSFQAMWSGGPPVQQVEPVAPAETPEKNILAASTVEFLSDETHAANLIASLIGLAARRNEPPLVLVTLEAEMDGQPSWGLELPYKEETILEQVNVGKAGFAAVYLDPEERQGDFETSSRQMIALRNRVSRRFRDTLLKVILVKMKPMPIFMYIPRGEETEDLPPVHLVVRVGQPEGMARASTIAHITILNSVFRKSFLSEWVSFIQTNPAYEYNLGEERALKEQGLDISSVEYSTVDPKTADALEGRISLSVKRTPSIATTNPTGKNKEATQRVLKEETLKEDWEELLRTVSRLRDLVTLAPGQSETPAENPS